jgi:hypothetical protein
MASDPRRQEQARKWGQVVAQAWSDEAFKRRLLAEPATVMREQGLDVPPGVELRVVENTGTVAHLVLPAKPAEGELSEAQLERAAGGMTDMTAGCVTNMCGAG